MTTVDTSMETNSISEDKAEQKRVRTYFKFNVAAQHSNVTSELCQNRKTQSPFWFVAVCNNASVSFKL